MKTFSEVSVTAGKLVGTRGLQFRKTSTSKPDDLRDKSGKDVGAARNYAHEKASVDRAEAQNKKREQEIEKRNKEADARMKETQKLAKEEIGLIESTHIFHVHMKPFDNRDHKMVDDKTSEPIGPAPKKSKLVLKVKAADHREAKNKVSKFVAKNYGINNISKIEHKGIQEETGTEARIKIKNVARPDDPAPTSEKSKLTKQAEIKTKVIDEEKPFMSRLDFGLSASVIAAARAIVEKKHDDDDDKKVGGKTDVVLRPETNDKLDDSDNDDDDDVKKESKHTTPKTDKEKSLARLAHPKNKITHKDVLVGRGVLKKEEVEIGEDYDTNTAVVNKPGHPLHGRNVNINSAKGKMFNVTGTIAGKPGSHTFDLHHNDLKNVKYDPKYNPGGDTYGRKKANEEVEFTHITEEIHPDYKLIKTGKKSTIAHPDGKPTYDVHHDGKKVATLEPYSAYKDTQSPGSKIVSSRKDVTKYSINSHVPKLKISGYERTGWNSSKDAAEGFIQRHQLHLNKTTNEEVEQIDELEKSTLASYVKKASDDATKHSYIAGKSGDVSKAAKASQRIRGIMKATDKLAKEEVEEISEDLSKYKMSYEKGAMDKSHDVKNVHLDLTKSPDYQHGEKGNTPERIRYLVRQHPKHAEIVKSGYRIAKYGEHKDSSTGKTTNEEVEQIDEISSTLLKSYKKKVGPGLQKNQKVGDTKRTNREQGFKVATNKLMGYNVKVPATEELLSTEELSRLEEIAKKFD